MRTRVLAAVVTAVFLLLAAIPPAMPPQAAAQQAAATGLHEHGHDESDASHDAALCGTQLLIDREGEFLRSIPYRPLSEIDPSEFQALGITDAPKFGQLDTLGESRQFWADNFNTGAKYQVTATLKRVTDHGYIYVDNTRPVSEAALDKLAAAWEGIYAKTTELFGNVPDVDGDPHITILLLDIQDDFSLNGSGGYIAGYYSSANQRALRTSNLREMFYLDTNPAVPDSDNSLQTLAHEFQHMINWNYHQAAGGQDTWLNEGLAEFAAYNAGYGHTTNLVLFLRDTNDDLVDWGYSARDYGTAYLFSLYLWEKYGGNTLIRDIAQHPGLSVDAVEAALEKHGHADRFRQVFNKWVVANYLDDDTGGGGAYGYRSFQLVDALVQGNPENNKTRFRRPPLTNNFASYPALTNGTIHHWAARYYRFTGSAPALNLGFTGRTGKLFGAAVVSTTSDGFPAGTNTVRNMTLADGANGSMAVAGFGAAAKSVVVIPSVQETAPGSAFTVTFQLTGGLSDGVIPVASPSPIAIPTVAVNPTFSPALGGPAAGVALPSLGAELTWSLPAGTTQYQLQVTPANGDGPAINLIRNAETSFTIPTPVLGQGNYILLPGMTYTWRVRATAKASFAAESDPSWGPWASRTFRTPAPSSTGMQAVSPASGATLTALTPAALQWSHPSPSLYYYEIQVSGDTRFDPNPATATSFVWWNLVHGGVTTPQNSWTTPALQPATTYYWRVRPRVQGDGTPVAWSQTFTFRTPGTAPAPAPTPVASPSPTPVASPSPSPTPAPPAADLAALEAAALARINLIRIQNALTPLNANAHLTTAARRHSTDMAARNVLSHTGSDGSSHSQRMTQAGYSWAASGEIIASGYPDALAVVDGWMNSPGHRNIILTGGYRDVGAGVARTASGKPYWTVVFGTPR